MPPHGTNAQTCRSGSMPPCADNPAARSHRLPLAHVVCVIGSSFIFLICSPEGHDFLDNLKNPVILAAAQKAGPVAFSVILSVVLQAGVEYVRQRLGI